MSRRSLLRHLGLLAAALFVPVLAGCPTTPSTTGKNGAPPATPTQKDPDKGKPDDAEPVKKPRHDPPDR